MAGYFNDNIYDEPKAVQAEWWRRQAVRLQAEHRRIANDIRNSMRMSEKLDREAEQE